jgi:hypothetical protein
MAVATDSKLGACLLDFQKTLNENSRVKKLIKKWNRAIFFEPTDSSELFTMVVTDQRITTVEPGHALNGMSQEDRILLQADVDTLIRIFSGDYNPATAHIDGALAVYSSDKDKVKLEAIAMVIWGLS